MLSLMEIPVGQKPNPKPKVPEILETVTKTTNLLPGEKSLKEKAEMIAKAKETKTKTRRSPILRRRRSM